MTQDQTPPVPASSAAAAPPSRKGRGLLGRLMGGTVLSILLISVLLNVYLGGILSAIFAGPQEVTYIEGDKGVDDRVVILPVEGTISDDTARFVQRALESIRVEKDDLPKALILRVDSGGGTVGASDRIWHDLRQFKQQHPQIPIVASFGSVAASGGYYIATAADHIIGEPTGMTGSIGVMAQLVTVDKLMEKLGVTPEVLHATTSPRKTVANDLMRPWNEEDRDLLLGFLDHAHQRFIEVVRQGRPQIAEEDLAQVTDGTVFNMDQAVERKLVDEQGYLEDAVAKAQALAKMDPTVRPRVTRIAPESGGLMGLLGVSRQGPDLMSRFDGEHLRETLIELATPRVEYRYHGPRP